MKDKVDNINSLDFKIDGLTVSNAAVKQTNDKVVVLTTAVQKGGEKYTVTLNEKAIGSFTGVSSVIPTTIKMTQQSVQGKVGQQVILSADVGVKEAGIPVTFNVDALGTSLNKDQVFEAVTNADGIATFSYTQYNAGNDAVAAYPTGAPSVRSLGYVFWGVDSILSVEEVTTGNTVNNGANKTYKVVSKDPKTGKVVANQVLNVSFLENINTTADKIADATVNGKQPVQFSNGTKTEATQITTDSKGEATFTVSGKNSSVTPIVFAANSYVDNGKTYFSQKYESDLLQVAASKVTFAALQAEYTIDLARDGSETAATGEKNGRKYNVVVKDKDGKLAKNEIVNVAFNEDLDRVISTNTKSKFIKVNSDGSQVFYPENAPSNENGAKQISVKTNDKGEASFVIGTETGNVNDYATPIAWIDINTADAKQGQLDEGEPKTVGAISYFVAPFLDGAALKVYNGSKEVKEFKGFESAEFKAELVNQSGKAMPGTSIKKVSYTIFNEGANDVKVGNQVISPNRSYTVTYEGSNTALFVKPAQDKNAKVRVVATGTAVDTDGKDFAFTAKEATATFTGTKEVGSIHTDEVVSFNSDKKELTFNGKDAVKYAGEKDVTYAYRGLGNTPIATADDFIKELQKGKVTVTREVKDNTTTFYIVEQDTSKEGPKDLATANSGATALAAALTKAKAVDTSKYTEATAKALTDAIVAAEALPTDATDAQKQAAADAINTAYAGLLVPTEIQGLEFTDFTSTTNMFGLKVFVVEGTVASGSADKIDLTVTHTDGSTSTVTVTDVVWKNFILKMKKS